MKNEDIEKHISEISREFRDGFAFLKKYPKSVSIFGSARMSPDNPHYRQAQELSEMIVSELEYAVITGGGPGIMEAANRGAKNANGTSLGLTIKLPREQQTNRYVTDEIGFGYFFTRKSMLNFAAEAYVFFPGGFGTFDELFGIITLVQTKKIPPVPIILVGRDFWNPLVAFIKKEMLEVHHAISPVDMKLFAVTDNLDNVIEIIRKAPVSEWWNIAD